MRRPGMAIAAMLAVAAASPSHRAWPSGMRAPVVPADNPMSAAKIELGRRLFYDADLSADGTMACATCHEHHRAFADGNATHAGVHGEPGRRNVPGLANIAWLRRLTWADPRVTSLEAQAAIPVTGLRPVEMGMAGNEVEIARRLAKDGCYPAMFARAFPGGGTIDFAQVAKALAAFERSLISFDTPYDAFRHGDRTALSSNAIAGVALFDRQCRSCHSGPLLSDQRYYRLRPLTTDVGLTEVTGRAGDAGRFRTPSLRNVELTGPYFHDGSAKTIIAAIRAHPDNAGLSNDEFPLVAAFLTSLTDHRFIADPRYALPVTACGRRL